MNLDAALQLLSQTPDAPLDVAEIALQLARDEYPDLDVEAYLGELNGIAHEARGYVRGDLNAQVTGLCRYLFHEMGFRGNTREYYDPRNSYLNEVLDRRTGIPITLSALAMAVAARVGLPLEGVGLPGHFIVKAVHNSLQFLFDPYHGGRRLTPTECETLVLQVTGQEFEATPEALQAVPLGAMVTRMLNNLKLVYLREGKFERAVRVMRRLIVLNPDDAVQHRDLGTSLLHAGQPGQAMDELAAYLQALPQADDAAAVFNLLKKARKQIAAWN